MVTSPILTDDSASVNQRIKKRTVFKGYVILETVNRLDQSIGAVFTALAQKGHLQNSVVLFLSDNGAQTFGVHQNFGSNWPLRGVSI